MLTRINSGFKVLVFVSLLARYYYLRRYDCYDNNDIFEAGVFSPGGSIGLQLQRQMQFICR